MTQPFGPFTQKQSFKRDHLQTRGNKVYGSLPGAASAFGHGVPGIEVVAGPPRVEPIHRRRDLPERGAYVSRVIVEPEFDAAVARQRGQAGERLTCRRDLRLDVWRRAVAPVARFEIAHAAACRRLQQGLRGGCGCRCEIRRHHRDLHAVRRYRLDRPRQVFGRTLRQHVARGTHREIDAIEAGILHRLPQITPAQIRQVLGKETEDRRLGRR